MRDLTLKLYEKRKEIPIDIACLMFYIKENNFEKIQEILEHKKFIEKIKEIHKDEIFEYCIKNKSEIHIITYVLTKIGFKIGNYGTICRKMSEYSDCDEKKKELCVFLLKISERSIHWYENNYFYAVNGQFSVMSILLESIGKENSKWMWSDTSVLYDYIAYLKDNFLQNDVKEKKLNIDLILSYMKNNEYTIITPCKCTKIEDGSYGKYEFKHNGGFYKLENCMHRIYPIDLIFEFGFRLKLDKKNYFLCDNSIEILIYLLENECGLNQEKCKEYLMKSKSVFKKRFEYVFKMWKMYKKIIFNKKIDDFCDIQINYYYNF